MAQAVVGLVVADGGHVGAQQVENFDGGDTLEVAVNDGAAEGIAGDGIEDVLLLAADLIDVTREHGEAAHADAVGFLRQKVPVDVIGVQNGQPGQVSAAGRVVVLAQPVQ